MKRYLVTTAVGLALVVRAVPIGAQECPDRTPAEITKAAVGSLTCQETIAKNGTKFAKIKMKKMAKCKSQQVPGLCPEQKDIDAIENAAAKAAAKIATDCDSDAAQAGLASSYASLTSPAVISSCMLSQHNARADILLGVIHGAEGVLNENADRDKCADKLAKTGIKYATGVMTAVAKCLKKQMEAGTTGDLAPVCVGSYPGGAFVPPTDTATANKLSKLVTSAANSVNKHCGSGAGPAGYIKSLFACPGAETVADLQECLVCEGWDAALDMIEQQYGESGTFVAHGPGAIQTAVNAASAGDKLLIDSGDYEEEITISTDDLKLVGCGGATDDRPRIVRPSTVGAHANGIFAVNTDGLVFQSLETYDWDDNGLLITNANGVTFRDIIADSNLNAAYGIFPVTSDNVVVEGCTTTNAVDSGIYIGQCTNVVVRYNRVEGNVAGIEFENSAYGVAHNNYVANNTAGILVFKSPGLASQLSNDHQVFNNVVVSNNTANFGIPGGLVSYVPDGTGLLVISTDRALVHHNLIQGNNTFGIAMVDQLMINALLGTNFYDPLSPDQTTEDNHVHDNVVTGNALAPDTTPPNESPAAADIIYWLGDDTNLGTCFENNDADIEAIVTANQCPYSP